uniref:AlNc14C19G2035 protein n=1 Tax=Albugo laibachii Nc14 TaxID=890382 RepID=F0W564_9STRA|nr:AlNc14C19G2035 [Albugo laibachii Nc14]|eukprot:CCA16255.1 AlNc14C19G2035 [Albugo laibachii Nc14]
MYREQRNSARRALTCVQLQNLLALLRWSSTSTNKFLELIPTSPDSSFQAKSWRLAGAIRCKLCKGTTTLSALGNFQTYYDRFRRTTKSPIYSYSVDLLPHSPSLIVISQYIRGHIDRPCISQSFVGVEPGISPESVPTTFNLFVQHNTPQPAKCTVSNILTFRITN